MGMIVQVCLRQVGQYQGLADRRQHNLNMLADLVGRDICGPGDIRERHAANMHGHVSRCVCHPLGECFTLCKEGEGSSRVVRMQ